MAVRVGSCLLSAFAFEMASSDYAWNGGCQHRKFRLVAKSPSFLRGYRRFIQVYASLINSERETLWARHNALLLANSLIIGALAISPAALWQNKWGALTMLSAGLIISAAWVGIAVKGWSLYDGILILPALSLWTASSTSPIRSQKASATGRKLRCTTLSCW